VGGPLIFGTKLVYFAEIIVGANLRWLVYIAPRERFDHRRH
jgi:hypothetical protein